MAILSQDRQLYDHQVVAAEAALAMVQAWCQQYGVEQVVMGNQTTAKQWQAKLSAQLPQSIPIIPIDERNSSLEARDRYWQMYPPSGLMRLIPKGMRLPSRPIDDIVAILLIERYLQQREGQ